MTKQKFAPIKAAIGFVLFSLVFCLLLALFYFPFNFFEDKMKGDQSLQTSAPRPTVIIDAGHGGKDGGTVGSDGQTVEKELNLDIAKRMQEILLAHGYEVIMTRSEDIMLSDPMITSSKKAGDLSARLKIMKSYENAIFISIHMNAFSDSRYSGLQVYYSANDQRSAALAQRIQSDTVKNLQPQNDRKVKRADENIYLLNRATCPAVLVECGFLSNPEECASLASPEYRAALAESICGSVCDYICENH